MHISPNSNYFLLYHDSQLLFSHFIQEIYVVSFLYSLGSQGYKEPQNFQTQRSHIYSESCRHRGVKLSQESEM